MTNGQKVSVSLLITILLFAAFAFASFAGLFDLLELRFYQPAVEKNAAHNLEQIAKSFDEYVESYRARFQNFVTSSLLQKTVLSTQSTEDIVQREDLIGRLLSETNGFLGLRVIDSNGRRVHYSSFKSDVMKSTKKSISYENYNDIDEIDYEKILCLEEDKFKLVFDEKLNRILYCFPFVDMYSAYRGTCVFYVAVKDFERFLVNKNIISYAESLGILMSESEEKAFVLDLPVTGSDLIKKEILVKWNEDNHKVVPLLLGEIDSWVMVKDNTSSLTKIIRVFNEKVFSFSKSIKILFLVCFFMTLFLVIFILFNLKHDEMVEIRDKIKKYQFGIISEYLEKKEEYNWDQISKEITLRKTNASNELKKTLGRSGKKHAAEVEKLLERSWEEIFAAIGKKESPKNQLGNVEEIKLLLEQLIQDKTYSIPVKQVASLVVEPTEVVTPVVESAKSDEVEELEEIDEVEELDEVEEIDEVEELEEVDEVEELEEVEELDEVEELEEVDEVEELDEVEEIDEVEELEEVEEIDEVDEVEEVEEVEEINEPEDNVDEYYELPPEEMKFGDVPRNVDEEVPEIDFQIVTPMFSVLDTYGLDHINIDESELLSDDDETVLEAEDVVEAVEVAEAEDVAEAEAVEVAEPEDVAEAVEVTEPEELEDGIEELGGVFANSFSFSNPFEDYTITDVITEDTEIVDGNIDNHEPIIEEDGLFSIGNVISMSENLIDHDFQKLVDSVL